MVADEHEAAAADVSGCGIDDGKGETDGYGCVNGVAAGFEDFDAGIGGVVLDGDDHRVLGARRFFGGGCLGCRLGYECGGDEGDGESGRNETGSEMHQAGSREV